MIRYPYPTYNFFSWDFGNFHEPAGLAHAPVATLLLIDSKVVLILN